LLIESTIYLLNGSYMASFSYFLQITGDLINK